MVNVIGGSFQALGLLGMDEGLDVLGVKVYIDSSFIFVSFHPLAISAPEDRRM